VCLVNWETARLASPATPRFRTIQACPKDPLTLPLAGWKMRQSACEAVVGLHYDRQRGTWEGETPT
jgi:hypothetical protein